MVSQLSLDELFVAAKLSPRAVFCRQMKLKIANGDIGEAQRDPCVVKPNDVAYCPSSYLSNDAVASDHVRFRISFLKSSPSCISGEVCLFLNKYLETCKKDYFSKKISEIEHDQKQLHRLTNNLMGNKRDVILKQR
jgi:hypothetical protein